MKTQPKLDIRKTIAGATFASLLAAVGLTSAATAQVVVPEGTIEVDLNISGYAQGSTSSDLSASAPGAPVGVPEDSWGVFQITSIDATSSSGETSQLFTDSGTTQYWGVYYGGIDTSAVVANGSIFFTGEELTLDVYQIEGTTAEDWDEVFAQSSSGRDLNNDGVISADEQDDYKGITDVGTKVYTATTEGSYTSIVTPLGGRFFTSAFGSLVPVSDTLLTGFDALDITFSIIGQPTTAASAEGGWTVLLGGDVLLTPVPEPSTYGLMAAGALVGFVAYRRRQQKRAAISA